MTEVLTVDPRTGERASTSIEETTPDELAAVGERAARAGRALGATDRAQRATLLREIAAGIRRRGSELIALAESETGLAVPRLTGEVERAAGQFELFAAVVEDGAYLEVMVDEAAGDAPEIRRLLVPVGPVAVFGASNFPFAFSVLGGDTASALAAGCAVVVKAHPSHPLTSQLSGEVLRDAGAAVLGGPDVVQLVHGFDAGVALVQHPSIRAATLTGSIHAARALQKAIDERPDPIPFFAELGSVNPLVVLPDAARTRSGEIAAGLVSSFTGSGGQLCTKPGFAFIPAGPEGDAIVETMRAQVTAAEPAVLLSENIQRGFERGAEAFGRNAEVLAVGGADAAVQGFRVRPTLIGIDAADVTGDVVEECFGPLLVLVRYGSPDDLLRALARFPASLTLTLHATDADRAAAEAVLDAMTSQSGRIIFNGFPTGVRVGWAQHHGGPWPSTNSQHTSVGATAIRRFLRPIAYQNAPEWALPAELRPQAAVVRRRNGVLEVPGDAADDG